MGVATVAGVAAFVTSVSKGRRGAEPGPAAALDEKTPMAALLQPLRESDGRALAVLFQRTVSAPGAAVPALTDQEAADWLGALRATGAGFPKFGSYGRASALTVASRVLQRFAVEPTPAAWVLALQPARELLTAGLEDGSLDVRVTALMEISKLWGWMPGRSILAKEENALADWKQGLIDPAVRRLGDREPMARAAAVACLGRLPIDAVAGQAVAYLDDPRSVEVRRQVLVSFAARPALLSEDVVLKHVFDQDPVIREAAELVLKSRGLTQEQISLGSMIFHPKPEIRASVIPLLKDRADVDPVVWLLQLSHDREESVRIGAVDALAARLSPEVGQRIAEMAATDKSPAVRQAASKYLPEIEKTAALPPLPGSPGLNPKAN
jgi:hypothetical protein